MQDMLPNIPTGYPLTAVAVILALIWYRLGKTEAHVHDLRNKLMPIWYWFEREMMGHRPHTERKGDSK